MIWPAGFNSLRAGPLRRKKQAWMFDNEIDWVMRLEMLQVRREARERRKILNTFEYKAEHKHVSWCKLLTQASVQVRRVSLGDK